MPVERDSCASHQRHVIGLYSFGKNWTASMITWPSAPSLVITTRPDFPFSNEKVPMEYQPPVGPLRWSTLTVVTRPTDATFTTAFDARFGCGEYRIRTSYFPDFGNSGVYIADCLPSLVPPSCR